VICLDELSVAVRDAMSDLLQTAGSIRKSREPQELEWNDFFYHLSVGIERQWADFLAARTK
jgi:hypothetical protein